LTGGLKIFILHFKIIITAGVGWGGGGTLVIA